VDSDRLKQNGTPDEAGDYTLESILAEYKSSAYILGERKLSKEELEKQADRILNEMKQSVFPAQTDTEEETLKEYKPERGAVSDEQHLDEGKTRKYHAKEKNSPQDSKTPEDKPDATRKNEIRQKKRSESEKPEHSDVKIYEKATDNAYRQKPRPGEVVKTEIKEEKEKHKKGDYKAEKEYEKKKARLEKLELQKQIIQERVKRQEELEAAYLSMSDSEQEFFGVGKYARSDSRIQYAEEVDEVIEKEAERRQRREERKKAKQTENNTAEPTRKEFEEPEISLEDAVKIYGSGIISLRRRTWAAFLICIVMVYFTLADDLKLALPRIFHSNPSALILFLVVLQLIVLFLGVDLFVTGIFDLFKGKIGAETLVSIACLASVADSVTMVLAGNNHFGLPFCTVTSVSMLCAMWGTRLGKSAYRRTFKTMSASKIPIAITADWEKTDMGIVLTKHLGTAKGFITKCTESDLAERAYLKMAPLMIVGALAFSVLAAVVKTQGHAFLHCFSAMTAVSASFSALLAFNLPFHSISKDLAGSGAAIAGWSGACDIKDAVAMVVKDNDLFPENTLSLNGVKVFSEQSVEKVVSYTGSMILASGSGLTRIFSDLLKEYACSIYRVEQFSCYEGGGIGAMIKGENVLVGSAAFMNLMGVRLSNNLNIKSAVFTAINEELAGVFIINYVPAGPVQSALLNLIRSKIKPLFAVRDFNITPSMVINKFSIPKEELEFPTFEARYNLSADSDERGIKPSAIMSREGLGHFVELVRGGRQLKAMTAISVMISVFGAVLGLLIMFFICWNGAYASGSPANTLTFMFSWMIPVLLLTGVGARS
jgi:hypothetical protein